MAQEMYDLAKIVVDIAFFAVAAYVIVKGVRRKKSEKQNQKDE